MNADELLDEVVAQTGLDDFGGDTYREGLDVLCDSLTREAQLNEIGQAALRGNIVGTLSNRLRIVDYRRRDATVEDERIEEPLVVIGMFRAGTTLLSRLLDQDAGNRALLSWEAGDSVPPPTPADHRVGPRVEAVRAGQQMLAQLNPAALAAHSEQADEATECVSLLAQDMKSLQWEAIANVPSYSEWLFGVSHLPAYEHHRRVLQVLQHGGVRGRWTLKTPHHAIALDELTTVYPDAKLVLLHRDPVVLCASVCSLINTLGGTFTSADFRDYIASHWPSVMQASIDRVNAFRDAHPEHPIVDVQYADLVRDPAGTVASIYAATGSSLSESAVEAIERYVRVNPKGKFGAHTYDLADFGLAESEIAERFSAYVDRYDVVSER